MVRSNGKWQQCRGWVSEKDTLEHTILSAYVAYDNEPGVEKKIPQVPGRGLGIYREDLYYWNGALRGQEAERMYLQEEC